MSVIKYSVSLLSGKLENLESVINNLEKQVVEVKILLRIIFELTKKN